MTHYGIVSISGDAQMGHGDLLTAAHIDGGPADALAYLLELVEPGSTFVFVATRDPEMVTRVAEGLEFALMHGLTDPIDSAGPTGTVVVHHNGYGA